MDFVDFDTAKKLKEKGYPQVKRNTLAMYSEYGEWFSLTQTIDDFEYSFVDFDEHDCVCPTISQVLKWLREEKKILVTIIPQEKNLGHDTLCFAVYKITEDLYQPIYTGTVNTLVDSYEQLSIAGIEYVLDNLI